MSDGKKYYCYCDSNCKYETMTKEQILAAIAQAVQTGKVGDCDTGFITRVKEINGGRYVTFWVGTQAEYNALETKELNCMYIITDDDQQGSLGKALNAFKEEVKPVRFTPALSWDSRTGGTNLVMDFPIKEYVYSPTAGVVHFQLSFEYDGDVSAGETIDFLHISGYTPKSIMPAQLSCLATDGAAAWEAQYHQNGVLRLKAKEDISTEYPYMLCISGWYFCDGEG